MATDMVIAAIAETCARAAGTFRRHRHGDFPMWDLRTGVSALRFTYERGPTERKSAVPTARNQTLRDLANEAHCSRVICVVGMTQAY